MDHSVCNMKAILAVAVLAMAAFAGVMMVGDDADAADGVTYKVTYVYGDNVKVETSGSQVTLKTFANVFGNIAPAGYAFDKWKIGSSLHDPEDTVDVTADITVEPVFKADDSIVKLVYGDVSKEFVKKGSETQYTVTVKDLLAFAEAIGAKLVDEDGTEVPANTDSVSSDMTLSTAGYEFKGFYDAAGASVAINALQGAKVEENIKMVTTFSAVFEKVYDISFIVEGASVLDITSDKVVLNSDKDAGLSRSIPGAPTKENYIFMGWYNAAGEKVIGYSSDKNEYTYSVKDFKFTENTTLYAKFVPVTFTVTFVYGEDRAVFATETVKYGDLAIEPKGLPEGYKGWDWNFGVPIEADTEIPAIEADPVTVYTVTFEIDGKALVTQRSDSMVLPDTAIEGKVFQGWVVKGESQYVSPMNYAITGDITFVAVYKEADPPAGPGFFQTTEGKCVGVLIAVVIIAFIYAVYTNMFGLKDVLTSVKITRVKK